jgi:hypothetical protein
MFESDSDEGQKNKVFDLSIGRSVACGRRWLAEMVAGTVTSVEQIAAGPRFRSRAGAFQSS